MHVTKEIKSEIKDDIRAAKKIRLPWWGLLCLFAGGIPIVWLFDHFGRIDIALPAFNIVGAFGFVIYLKWKLRRNAWFWITIAIIAALHVPLILFAPWPTRWVPASVFAGIASLDICVMLLIIAVVGKFAERSQISGT
jgi:hypothetical protein